MTTKTSVGFASTWPDSNQQPHRTKPFHS